MVQTLNFFCILFSGSFIADGKKVAEAENNFTYSYAVTRRFSSKNLFRKPSQNSKTKNCMAVSFQLKLQALAGLSETFEQLFLYFLGGVCSTRI